MPVENGFVDYLANPLNVFSVRVGTFVIDDTDARYSYGRKAYPHKPKGKLSHILLGSQIVLVAASFFGGLYLLFDTFSKLLGSSSSSSNTTLDALLGFAGLVVGILYGAKLAFGY